MKKRAVALARPIAGALACLAFIALCASAPWAEDRVITERAKAMIERKGTDVLVLGIHGFKILNVHMLIVPYNPAIYDVDHNIMTLEDLKVPCEAYVTYRKVGNNVPQLSKVEVLLDYATSKTDFTARSLSKKKFR